MPDRSDQDPAKARYEQTHKLFLEALDVEPACEREDWVRCQSEFSDEVHEHVLAMLRADANLESSLNPCEANENGQTPTFSQDDSSMKGSSHSFPQMDNFQIIEEIARGGMGVVYKARQCRPNRLVAIKMIRAGVFASKMEIERFFTEAEAAAQLATLLFGADSANSPLVLLYHVIVAGSILRCRTNSVAYVTLLSMSGYALHLLYLLWDPERLPDITTYVPMLLSLLLIGVIQYLSLRRSAASYESQGAMARG